MDAHTIAEKLTKAQKRLVLDSEPDDITGEEGCGVEIEGPLYRVAHALLELEVGDYTHGSPYGDLYFNNALGLEVRNILLNGEGK